MGWCPSCENGDIFLTSLISEFLIRKRGDNSNSTFYPQLLIKINYTTGKTFLKVVHKWWKLSNNVRDSIYLFELGKIRAHRELYKGEFWFVLKKHFVSKVAV